MLVFDETDASAVQQSANGEKGGESNRRICGDRQRRTARSLYQRVITEIVRPTETGLRVVPAISTNLCHEGTAHTVTRRQRADRRREFSPAANIRAIHILASINCYCKRITVNDLRTAGCNDNLQIAHGEI